MTARAWTTGELKVMREFASLGAPAVADLLERSVSSVEAKARELRLSLSNTGDDVDVSRETVAILSRLKMAHRLPICPSCGLRVAIMRTTGMCRVCHLDQLIELRETQMQELVRERKLTKLRQDKRRLRVCDICGDAFYPRVAEKPDVCSKCDELL